MSSRHRTAANILALVLLAYGLIVSATVRARSFGSALVQQVLVAGPNQGNPEPQRTPSTPIGTIPASFLVDDRGAARVSVPIAVPPAARGTQPRLSLEYDSQLGDGPLGVGWQLGGLSAVTRCDHTLADDGEVAPVRMTEDDGLCLDGERLMLVEGDAFEVGATYRPKRDDFTRVRVVESLGEGSHGSCDGDFGFEARRRDGTIATYGCRRDAVVHTHLGARTWKLAQVRDRFGNYVDYRYGYETEAVTNNEGQLLGEADVEHYQSAIDYGAHLDLHAPTRHVRFDWEPRPDPSTGYMLGAPQHQSQRLRGIATYAAGELVHRYELDYDTPSITGRSLLHAVRQCDAEGVCKPDTTFEWEPGELAVEPLAEGENFNNLHAWPFMDIDGDLDAPYPLVLRQSILDANGDGRTDMLLAVGDNDSSPVEDRGWELWTSQPGAETNYWAICGTSKPNFQACADSGRYVVHEDARSGSLADQTVGDMGFARPPLFATDYDGDGRDDAVALGPNQYHSGGLPPSGTCLFIAQSRPEGGVEQFEFDPEIGNIWWFVASDQTGDGLGDLLICGGKSQLDAEGEPASATGSWFFVPNRPGAGFDADDRVDTGVACSAYDKFLHFDHDGDGLASLLVIPVWDPVSKTRIPSYEWSNYHALRLDPHDGWALSFEDIGLPPDLAQRWRSAIVNPVSLEEINADFPLSMQGIGIDKVLDLNGDGLPDILRYQLEIGDTAEQLGAMMQTIVGDDPPLDEWGGVRIWLNTGAGFRDAGWLTQADEPGDHFFRRFSAAGVLDYDGDGHLDYLTPVDDPDDNHWKWSIWTSQGDGSFVEWPEVIDAAYDDVTHTARSMGAFDLDGDGLHDPGVFHAANWTLWEHAGAAPDRLVALEDGLGARYEVDYRSLTDFDAPEGFYALDLDACVYPERCERDPRIVVERHRIDSGITGQPRIFEHRYGTARSDREGGRGLGFDRHETIEWSEVDGQLEPIVRRAVRFDHHYDEALGDFPYAGIPASVVEDQRDPQTGRHRVSVRGRVFDHVETTGLSYYPYASQQVSRVYELPACAETFCDTFFELDDAYRVSGEVETVFEVDAFGNPLLRTSSADTGPTTLSYRYETSYQNDAESWLLGLPTHERVTFLQSGVEPRERNSAAFYDDTGALQARVTEPTQPELYLHESFGYDAHGNVASITAADADAELRARAIAYDEHGVFPIAVTNALGHKSHLRWDPGLGVAIEARDPNDLRTVVDYDGLGHATGVRHFAGELPRGDETTLSYAAIAPVDDGPVLAIQAETAGHGYAVAEYDRLGRVVVERELSLDGVERFVATEYDRLGRVRATSLPTPAGQAPVGWEWLDYDFADRLALRTLPDGTTESWSYHGLDGLEVEHVDIGGSVSLLRYDTASRLVESIRALGTPDEERLCFDYGAFELLARVRPDCVERADAAKIDPGDAPPTIKSFIYDDLGQLILSHDPSEGQRSYFYNGHGELEALVDGKGDEVVFVRDLLGRVIERSDADGETTWSWDTTFIGALGSSLSPSGHEELRDYDPFGRLKRLTKVVGGESFDLELEYDGHDRLAEIHYPSHDALPPFWIRNVHAPNGELRAVRAGPDDALLWRVEALSDEGRISAERFGEQTLTQRDYDPLRGFVKSIETTSNLGGTIQSLGYEWNADGTLHRRQDAIHHQSERMDYDALHRVTEVHTSKGLQQHARYFAYDSLGNLVYATDRGEYDYDGEGRLAVADGQAYEWDPNGNLLARTGNDPATFHYTAFDKLAELETEAGSTVFEYDAEQERVYRYAEAEGRETIYVSELYQRHHDDETGETQHHYYVPGLERTVASVVDRVDLITAERQVHFIHVDHLGSTYAISDASGVVEQRMAFDVWGKRRDPSDWTLPEDFAALGPVNLGYTGHEAQEDGGLINMGGRMYDPHLGRMASADPLVVDPTSAQGWNRYAYVLNRPLALTDPSGFEPTKAGEGDPGGGSEGGGGAEGHPGGDSGVLGAGEFTPAPSHVKPGGSSTPKSGADQRAGDNGPSTDGAASQGAHPGGGPSGNHGSGLDDLANGLISIADDVLHEGIQRLGPGLPPPTDPVQAFTDAMVPDESPAQERRRRSVSHEVGQRVIGTMEDPPEYVVVSIEITLFLIGGDLEAVGTVVKGGRRVIMREATEEGLPLVAGVVKRSKRRASTLAPGSHAKESVAARGPSRKFTRSEREAVNEIGRKQGCHTCGTKDPGTRSGNFVPDHQPPNAVNESGKPQKLYPHCLSCSRRQGGQVRQLKK